MSSKRVVHRRPNYKEMGRCLVHLNIVGDTDQYGSHFDLQCALFVFVVQELHNSATWIFRTKQVGHMKPECCRKHFQENTLLCVLTLSMFLLCCYIVKGKSTPGVYNK